MTKCKQASKSRIMLAPMEGVVDAPMREFLTEIGGYDRCVTEFIRVVDLTHPRHVFTRYCPELNNGGRTASGTPVFVQLLGSNPDAMAKNACKVAKMGALGIDVNFGCPSKTVNNSDGGAAVLREPVRVGEILTALRDAVPDDTTVTAKIRLGFEHADDFSEIIEAVKTSGVNELCVHARTKKHGYRPPAYWSRVAEASENLDIPVVINGEIWTSQDAQQACDESHCKDIMLGRGAISCPDLALQIRADNAGMAYKPLAWEVVWRKVRGQVMRDNDMPRYAGMRAKQWLRYLMTYYPEAVTIFNTIKRCQTVDEMLNIWE